MDRNLYQIDPTPFPENNREAAADPLPFAPLSRSLIVKKSRGVFRIFFKKYTTGPAGFQGHGDAPFQLPAFPGRTGVTLTIFQRYFKSRANTDFTRAFFLNPPPCQEFFKTGPPPGFLSRIERSGYSGFLSIPIDQYRSGTSGQASVRVSPSKKIIPWRTAETHSCRGMRGHSPRIRPGRISTLCAGDP